MVKENENGKDYPSLVLTILCDNISLVIFLLLGLLLAITLIGMLIDNFLPVKLFFLFSIVFFSIYCATTLILLIRANIILRLQGKLDNN